VLAQRDGPLLPDPEGDVPAVLGEAGPEEAAGGPGPDHEDAAGQAGRPWPANVNSTLPPRPADRACAKAARYSLSG
jgi:hypothetical protein